MKYETTPFRWSEPAILRALGVYFQWYNKLCCPNVREGSEMDLLMITKSDRIWEIEVKISLVDWKNDIAKNKHYTKGWEPSRFYYAIPYTLIKNGIPAWVPEHAGIILLDWRDDPLIPVVMKCERAAKRLHNNKIGIDIKCEILRKVYFRYWTHVLSKKPDQQSVPPTHTPTIQASQVQ
jgi:hypothetical protein